MSNVDKLTRAENELETVNKQLAALQERAKAVQQRVLKLRSEKILELVKNAGMGPNEIREILSAYQTGRLPQRAGGYGNAEANTNEEDSSCPQENELEVDTENEKF